MKRGWTRLAVLLSMVAATAVVTIVKLVQIEAVAELSLLEAWAGAGALVLGSGK